MSTTDLARAELSLRIIRETMHAQAAMAALGRAAPNDRIRRGGRSERATASHWRRCKRHLRRVAEARSQLALLAPC